MISQKYGRAYHYLFSSGTTSDHRINHMYCADIREVKRFIHIEKLDGENNCFNKCLNEFPHSVFKYVRKGHTKQIRVLDS